MADTIAAIATAVSISAIGIIRVSGDAAIDIACRIFRAKNKTDLKTAKDRTLYLGDLLGENGDVIDICLCTVSRGPNSYTGEDTVEFQCHGSPVVLADGLRSLFSHGARQAGPGEFTKRAFLNGRMDLSQAEAVIDLIDAETSAAAQNAAAQLDGAIFRKISSIYDSLLDIMAHFHAVLDYPDEDIDDFKLKNYIAVLQDAKTSLSLLNDTFARGQIMKNGVKTAIIGRPNAGKSSLLNALLGYDRAIVTDIAGTTRDTIEEKVSLGKILLRLIDTAGIRQTDDTIEALGVERSKSAAESAQLVLAVFDGSQPLTDEDMQVIKAAKEAPMCIAVINKSDLEQKTDVSYISSVIPETCVVSALTGSGIKLIETAVSSMLDGGDSSIPAGEILTNARQAQAVSCAIESLSAAHNAMEQGITADAALTEIEAALSFLGEITGKTIREDITSRIFERFCVGK